MDEFHGVHRAVLGGELVAMLDEHALVLNAADGESQGVLRRGAQPCSEAILHLVPNEVEVVVADGNFEFAASL